MLSSMRSLVAFSPTMSSDAFKHRNETILKTHHATDLISHALDFSVNTE